MSQNANIKPYVLQSVINQNGMNLTTVEIEGGATLTVVANQNGMNVTLIEHS